MSESDPSNRREEVPVQPIYRARISDVFATISLGTLIAAMGLLYSFFHNIGQDADTKIKDAENRITKRIERLEDRIDRKR